MEQCLVLIGSVKNNEASSFGSGFLISFKSNLFIVTCKHVIYEAGLENLFAIPNPKMTKSPIGGYKILPISKLHFHPDDTINNTYDIVVCEFKESSIDDLKQISFLEVENTSNYSNPIVNDVIKAFGFPIEYAEPLFANNREDKMPPYKIQGTIQDIPISGLSQTGFIGKLNEGFFAWTPRNTQELKGLSGGLITISKNSNTKPCGVILGSADINICINSQNVDFKGIIFAKFDRVLDILKSFHYEQSS
ncbi:MAG: serine protease [Bacteroidales bacterium]|nr:serine protease [Bacteroidales bacterium]